MLRVIVALFIITFVSVLYNPEIASEAILDWRTIEKAREMEIEKQEQIEQDELSKTLVVKAYEWEGKEAGQCVEFVQRFVGQLDNCSTINCYDLPFRGAAKNIQPNVGDPEVGYAIFTDDGKFGHAAVIIEIEDDTLILAESNFGTKEIVTVGRRIDINDESIRGYFKFVGI